ncbi:MAG: hypothetical protein ACR2OB_09475 [Solirubrobacteraceae bacterium]
MNELSRFRWLIVRKYSQASLAFIIGAVMMIVGGLVELVYGIKAEGRGLEDIATPLTVEDRPSGRPPAAAGATA